MNDQDFQVFTAMEKYGGSFVKQLAHLAFHADPQNLQKIKDTWSEYYKTYKSML